MPKSLSASIVVDLYPTAAVGLVALLQGKVTSQNSLQLLVSKKCDLADSIGSDLASIESLFAWIAKVAEDLTAAFDRRSGLLPPHSASNTTSTSWLCRVPPYDVRHSCVDVAKRTSKQYLERACVDRNNNFAARYTWGLAEK